MRLRIFLTLTALCISKASRIAPEEESSTDSFSEENSNLPDGVIFSNATDLIIEESPATVISSDLLRPFPGLKHFQMAARVRSIEDDAFASAKSLAVLRLDNNILSTVPSAALKGLGGLEILSINNNGLQALRRGDEFLSLVHLRSLSLSENIISYVHPLTFAPLSRLTMLNVSRNQLTTLDGLGFPARNALEVLDLSYNYIKLLNPTRLQPLQALRELYLVGNLLDALRGNTFAGSDQLERLDLSDNFLKSLPERLFQANRKLMELNLAENLLETVPADVFEGLNRLRGLNLRNNRLTRLADGTFRDQSTFAMLSLEGNRFERFEMVFLKSSDVLLQNNRLSALTKLSAMKVTLVRGFFLYGNEIVTIERNAFEAFPQLESVYLDHNRIKNIPTMLFHTNHHLQHVTLSHNRLTVLRTNTFAGLRRLHSVDLSYNELVTVEPGSFHGSPLEYLNLNGNRLKAIEESSFSGTNLLYLCVDSNEIDSLSENNSALTGLTMLSAANNRIDTCEQFLCRRNFPKLTDVNLSNNSLTSTQDRECPGQPHPSDRGYLDPIVLNLAYNKLSQVPVFDGRVLSLDLSGNDLSNLEDGYHFRSYQQTETLLLRNTRLSRLWPNNFSYLTHLTHLEVSSSALESVEEETFHSLKLTWLEIVHSPLKALPGNLLVGQRNLSVVSFAHNELSFLAPRFFNECHQLQDIDLSYNTFESIDQSWFQGLEHLKSIDLEGNRLTLLPTDLLSPEQSLEKFSVAGNGLSSIADVAFLADVPIRMLNLSHNGLLEIDILNRNEFVTHLDVSGNRLNRLHVRPGHRVVLANSNQIESLSWESGDDLKFELQNLALADNALTKMDPRLFEVRTITEIDVSENRLEGFPFELLHRPKWLRTVIVSRNNIRTVPEDGIERFKLETLDLSENPLEGLPERFLSRCVVNNLLVDVVE